MGMGSMERSFKKNAEGTKGLDTAGEWRRGGSDWLKDRIWERKGVKKGFSPSSRDRAVVDGMEEISLGGEGPGSAGPLYYSDMSPLKAVNLMTRGELRDDTATGRRRRPRGRRVTGERRRSQACLGREISISCRTGGDWRVPLLDTCARSDCPRVEEKIMGLKILVICCPGEVRTGLGMLGFLVDTCCRR